jgi:hypothetical protein
MDNLENIVTELRRRGEIAADLFGWSVERKVGFFYWLNETAFGMIPLPTGEFERTDPASFHLTDDQAFSPGLESLLPRHIRFSIGRYTAAKAIMSWASNPPAAYERTDVEQLADMYVDRSDLSRIDLKVIDFSDAFDIAPLAACYNKDGGVRDWLKQENQVNIDLGGPGHADMVLERIHTPSVYVKYGDDAVEIHDGWHRTAGALVAGGLTLPAILVPLPAREVDCTSTSTMSM